ncbi:hypothetical protein P5V15_015820 [Pogonomyrmex californicus]
MNTADHTLFNCASWSNERNELYDVIGVVNNLYDFVTSLLDNGEAWEAFHQFSEKVMGAKEEYERTRQGLPNLVNLPWP